MEHHFYCERAERNKNIVREALCRVLGTNRVDEREIARFFSGDYTQHVDGHTLDYQALIKHLQAQKEVISSMEITFTALVAEGDTVFSSHNVRVTKKDGKSVTVKVLAQFLIKEDKIAACDELTRMLEGEENDRDLGSRQ